jgi:hypothetical protein
MNSYTVFRTRLRAIGYPTSLIVLFVAAQSCSKSDSGTTVMPTTPAATVVGTWTLADVTITTGTKTQTLSRDNATKGGYVSANDLTLTSDNKYTQGTASGTWAVSASKLKLGSKTVEVFTLDDTNLKIGNVFPDIKSATVADRDAAGLDAVFITQKMLDIINGGAFDPNNDKTATYQLNYRRK